MRLHVFAVIPLFCLGSIACSSSTPPPTTADLSNPCPPGQFCTQPTATAPVATAPAPTATTASATPLPAGAALITPVLNAIGNSEAPGMKADGSAFAGQFQEGQTLEQPFNIQAGKCYTVIAASTGAITELDVQLVAEAAPLPKMVLAQDNTTGPNATLGGKKDGCWKNPTPLAGPGKIILKATKGSGLAAAQVFVK